MKKFIGILLACGLVSCSSCTGPKTDPVVPDSSVDAGVDAAGKPVTVTSNGWSLTFPNGNWHLDLTNALNELRDAADPATATAFINEVDKNLVLVATQPFAGTAQQFTLLAVRGLVDSGGKIVNTKSVTVNGMSFLYIESSRPDGDNIWAWLGLKNGVAYSFVCGGLESGDAGQFLLCDQVASSFKVQ